MFYSNKSKTTKQICGISKQYLWFSTTKYLRLFLLFPKQCLIKIIPFPQNSPLCEIPSHITMIQKQQKFKIQINNVP